MSRCELECVIEEISDMEMGQVYIWGRSYFKNESVTHVKYIFLRYVRR